MQLMHAIDQIGAPELPTRCLVLLLKSRRISDYYMKESIAFLRQRAMPTPRQIATAEAGGKPLTSFHKMALLIMPVMTLLIMPVLRWPASSCPCSPS